MLKSEIVKTFDERRNEFTPYGFTCELWAPKPMDKLDRHNEIELNYLPEGTLTYFFKECRITVPAGRLILFWGLIPHKIVDYEHLSSYYVCTIPLAQFLAWNLPGSFVDRVLQGEMMMESDERFSSYDLFLMDNWLRDADKQKADVSLSEMQGRMVRLADNVLSGQPNTSSFLLKEEVSLVEKMAIYIAKNYSNPIRVSDVGKAVGLHPDYANAIFKKTFGCTLSEFIVAERITHAQRKLLASHLSITQIAFDSGFNSVSRFNSAFLKTNGCTPREYRKQALSPSLDL